MKIDDEDIFRMIFAVLIVIAISSAATIHQFGIMMAWHGMILLFLTGTTISAFAWKTQVWLNSHADKSWDTSAITDEDIRSFMRNEKQYAFKTEGFITKETHQEQLRMLAIKGLHKLAEDPEVHDMDQHTIDVTLENKTKLKFWIGNKKSNRSLWKVYYPDGTVYKNDSKDKFLSEAEQTFLEQVKQHRLGKLSIDAVGAACPEDFESKYAHMIHNVERQRVLQQQQALTNSLARQQYLRDRAQAGTGAQGIIGLIGH